MNKLITAVCLLLLLFAESAFSMTGKVFTKFVPIWNYRPNDCTSFNSNQSVLSLRDTGVFLDYGLFSLEYRMDISTNEIPMPMPWEGLYIPPDYYRPIESVPIPPMGPGAVTVGWHPFDPLFLGLMARWYTLNDEGTSLDTNTNGITNLDYRSSISYNFVGIEARIEYRFSDYLSAKFDKIVMNFYGGKGFLSYKNATTNMTNTYTSSCNNWILPLTLSFRPRPLGFELGGIMKGANALVQEYFDTSYSGVTTNHKTMVNFGYEVYGQLFWDISDEFQFCSKLAFQTYHTKISVDNGGSVTNLSLYDWLFLSPFLELTYTGIPRTTLRLGAGWQFTIYHNENMISYNGSSSNAVNNVQSQPGLIRWDPLIEFGGLFDITDSLDIEIIGKMMCSPIYWDNYAEGVSKDGSVDYATRNSPMAFNSEGSVGIVISYKF